MNGITAYILTVTAAAILTAVLRQVSGSGTMGALVKFLGGIFMTLTVLSPIVKLELPDLESWFDTIQYDGAAAAAAGEDMAKDAARDIIKQQTEAYILDKATALGAEVTADVEVDEEGIPVRVALTGEISPTVQTAMAQWLETELGIGKGAQDWHN